MINHYKALANHIITRNTKLNRPTTNRPIKVSLDDPAIIVMTDLNEVTPFSIEPTASIDATNDKMIASGVRLLFVIDADRTLQGLVTATDILGEKPMKYITEHGGKREDILCQDIMTPHQQLDALNLKDVERARVGDVMETLKLLQRQHILVTETTAEDSEIIRGLFSTSQISHQVGLHIESTERANTFAELEQVLVG